MPKIPKSALYFLILLLAITAVLGSSTWFRPGNAGTRSSLSSRYVLYSSDIINQVPDFNYSHCEIVDGMDSEALIFDSGTQPIITTQDGNIIKLYDTDCNILEEYNTGDTIYGMLITNLDEDEYQEIAVNNGSRISFYEYGDYGLSLIAYHDLISGGGNVAAALWGSFVCNRKEDGVSMFCIMHNATTSGLYLWNYTDNTVKRSTTGATTQGTQASDTEENAGAYYYNPDLDRYYIYFSGGYGTDLYYMIFDQNLAFYDREAAGHEILSRHGLFPVLIGNTFRSIIEYRYTDGSYKHYNEIYEMDDLTSIYTTWNRGINIPNFTSNYIVGDYNHDGTKEACYYENRTPALTCVNAAGTVLINTSTSLKINDTAIVMGDFNSSNDKHLLANKNGIYDITRGYVYTTNATYKAKQFNSYCSVISYGASGTPLVVCGDDNSIIIMKNSAVDESCGNGVCEIFENSYSCPEDCTGDEPGVTATPECYSSSQCRGTELCIGGVCQEGAECLTSADCPTNYPVCLFNFCVRGWKPEDGNFTCVFAQDCPSNLPVCFNGICVGAVYGMSGASAEDQSETQFDDLITPLLGNNPKTRFIVGLALILAIVGIVGAEFKNVYITGVALALSLGLTVVLNLIPVWVLILISVTSTGILLLIKMAFQGNNAKG